MKAVKKILMVILCGVLLCVFAGGAYYITATAGTTLNEEKLERTDACIEVYDNSNGKVADLSFRSANKSVRIKELPKHVPSAFVAAEDKNFYSHRGLDYKGMARALIKNLQAGSFKQGASTISQQLIKNTQLTSEKTIARKLKEIKLTRKLEKKYSKDEIMEMYLNTIYFGHACYGIASAADFYFSKNAENLSVAEAAMLAALIRSPNHYSPFADPEKCAAARNGVLRRMFALGFIGENVYEQAEKESLPQKEDNSVTAKTYLSGVYSEMESLPFYSPYAFRHGCKIYTYMDKDLQEYAENLKTDADRSGKSILVCDNRTHGISAWFTSEGEMRRQPGSVIKPLAVYAPAIEENKISPCTPVLDEKTDFGGYTPSNYKDAYKGYVSVRQALAESLNIPAVKILNALGIEKSEQYLRKMQLMLTEDDKNLSLALGGLRDGFTARQLTAAYAVFANEGKYAPLAFIRKIEDADGNAIYERQTIPQRVFSEDSVELINDILQCAAKSGTAKKLASLPFPVCAKTGTCGTDEGNTDAWTITYTSKNTVCVWMGNADNSLTDITGGGLPCHYALLLNKRMYRNRVPADFERSDKIVECLLDKISYERDHVIKLASPDQPESYTFKDIFRAGNCPKEYSRTFGEPYASAKVRYDNTAICIELCQTEYYDYKIKRLENGKTSLIFDGHCDEIFRDEDVVSGKRYVYILQPYFIGQSGEKHFGKEITLPAVFTKQKAKDLPSNWWCS